MKLVSIPKDQYEAYRLNIIFKAYKWDPQFLDNGTVAKHVLVLSKEEHQELSHLVKLLGQETELAEIEIHGNSKLTKKLNLPRKLRHDLVSMNNYNAKDHIRLMRFDFHPIVEGGWAISEVNSDVPGGFAESSIMPLYAAELFPNRAYQVKSFHSVMISEIKKKVALGGRIMMVHCTSYSDDRQVMQFLGDELKKEGFEIIYAAADHVRFKDTKAYSILDNNEGAIDAIIRFNPMEWVVDIKPKYWDGYFSTTTLSCNHPIAIYAQSKNFPLIWDALESKGVDLTTWRQLLPHTLSIKNYKQEEGYIYKPVWGRVGENISIKEACREDEYEKILKDVKRKPKRYIAQKKFNSLAIQDEAGNSYHICIGAYYVNGKAAGYYCRMSDKARIDSFASDIPVVIEGDSYETY